ncbi:MAG: hypothetical protein VX772_02615 [Bacteroidota bacterium]|uniref:Uncharacterized protein n=1 Tax=Flagellimonas okinawensis TaxID=3031324 RepID=A0ABT5XKP3_9FLAO|nr:hypothetical protein [[Muricauda] okinawensis]MDF0706459.1 hypothetical protein [[Muricauda] okinawensis]MEC8831226.1 hypothetical protein [Bacteroidota bacterium]
MTIQKRQIVILSSVLALLAIPFIAMQFSSEVQWSLFDFIVAGGLLTVLGFTIDLALKKITGTKRIMAVATIVLFFLLIWAELAVGVFGSPLAGS